MGRATDLADLDMLARRPAAAPDQARLAELERYQILDTPPEEQFDRIATLARVLFDTPIAAITLVDHDRQWFKAQSGLNASQSPRAESFCSHAMESENVFVVQDASLDERFAEFPNVTGEPHIRFYAGAPLRSSNGANLGAVCVISPEPRAFAEDDRRKLEILARIVETEMELRLSANSANRAMKQQDVSLKEAHFKIKSSLEFANLLADVERSEMETEKLAIVAMAAWQQYSSAGAILYASIKALRDQLSNADYRALIDQMPGFSV
jgi:hypothetical protein